MGGWLCAHVFAGFVTDKKPSSGAKASGGGGRAWRKRGSVRGKGGGREQQASASHITNARDAPWRHLLRGARGKARGWGEGRRAWHRGLPSRVWHSAGYLSARLLSCLSSLLLPLGLGSRSRRRKRGNSAPCLSSDTESFITRTTLALSVNIHTSSLFTQAHTRTHVHVHMSISQRT